MIHVRWVFCTCVKLSRKASFSKFSWRWIQSLHLLELPLTLVPYFETALLKHSCGNCFLHCLFWQVHWPRVVLRFTQEVHTSLTLPSGRSHMRCWNSIEPFSWLQTAQRFRSQSWHSTFVDRENHWALEKSTLTLDFWQLSHVLDKQSLHSHDPVGFDFSDRLAWAFTVAFASAKWLGSGTSSSNGSALLRRLDVMEQNGTRDIGQEQKSLPFSMCGQITQLAGR